MDTITLIVKCPHCGAEKKVASSKERWYNLHYTFWSDSRIESDEFCEPGHTQQCSECGKFFCIPPIKTLPSSEDPCNETGTLPLQSLKKAIEELSGDERAEEWARLKLGGHTIACMLIPILSRRKKRHTIAQICNGLWTIIPRTLKGLVICYLN